MKYATPVFCMTVLLAIGCGGGDGDNAATVTGKACFGNEPEPTPAEIEESLASNWLQITARESDAGFTFYLDGDNTPLKLSQLQSALDIYSQRVDLSGKLEGRNADGISANPVRFLADPSVSSLAFSLVLELMPRFMLYRMRVELIVGENQLHRWIELPRDEGLGTRPGPEVVGTDLRISRAETRIEYLVRGDDGEREPLEGTGFEQSVLGKSATPQKIGSLRDAFAKEFGARESDAGVTLDEIEIAATTKMLPSRGDYAPWGAVFIAVDGLRKLESERKDQRKLMIKFKFTDAEGALKRE